MLGNKAKSEAMYNEMWKTSVQYVNYYLSLPERFIQHEYKLLRYAFADTLSIRSSQ